MSASPKYDSTPSYLSVGMIVGIVFVIIICCACGFICYTKIPKALVLVTDDPPSFATPSQPVTPVGPPQADLVLPQSYQQQSPAQAQQFLPAPYLQAQQHPIAIAYEIPVADATAFTYVDDDAAASAATTTTTTASTTYPAAAATRFADHIHTSIASGPVSSGIDQNHPPLQPRLSPVALNNNQNNYTRSIFNATSGGEALEIPFEVLVAWTNNFNMANKRGEGKFGEVFSCYLPDYKTGIAIKKMRPSGGFYSLSSLNVEIKVLSTFKHPNIIRLLGYSAPSTDQMCLVYELGEIGDLAKALENNEMSQQLTWKLRLKIASGIVNALNYLHCHQPGRPAYHRDVKSSNIVLMKDLTPKLIDCGLAKYTNIDDNIPSDSISFGQSRAVRFGTPGYICRNYDMTGVYDAKAEVYSVGIVLLELITGCIQGKYHNTQGISMFLEEALDRHWIVPDPRAGVWSDVCVSEFLSLASGCVAVHWERLPAMVDVLRQIRSLENQYYVADVRNVDSDVIRLRHNSELQRQAREESAAQSPLRDRQPPRECAICFDLFTVETGLECRGSGRHFLCEGCFSRQVESDVGPYQRRNFLANTGKILCVFCFNAYEERDLARVCRQETYVLYRRAYEEKLVAGIIRDQQREYKVRLEEVRREAEQLGEARQVALHRHRLHILEELLTLHCPRSSCRAELVEFEGSFALTCQTCMCGFCGWCLKDCGQDAHTHVKGCPRSLSPGGYYGTQEQFHHVHRTRHGLELSTYLSTIEDGVLRADVMVIVSKDLSDLGISL